MVLSTNDLNFYFLLTVPGLFGHSTTSVAQRDRDDCSIEVGFLGCRNCSYFFKKWANPGLFFCLFLFFYMTQIKVIDKSVDGVLGTRTHGGRMEGVDESTELLLLFY